LIVSCAPAPRANVAAPHATTMALTMSRSLTGALLQMTTGDRADEDVRLAESQERPVDFGRQTRGGGGSGRAARSRADAGRVEMRSLGAKAFTPIVAAGRTPMPPASDTRAESARTQALRILHVASS